MTNAHDQRAIDHPAVKHLLRYFTCNDPNHSLADPWMTRQEGGTITLEWPPGGGDYALCSRELIEQMVNMHNEMIAERDESKRRFDALFDRTEHLIWPG